jgi:predicted dienelactone hydrolase
MWRIFCVAIALFTAAPCVLAKECGVSGVGYRTMRLGDRITAVWYPTEATPSQYAYGPNFSGSVAIDAPPAMACGEPVPLVVFSHGYLGCGVQSVAFTEELARHGYVVAAPDHADALLCHIARLPAPQQRRARPNFLKPDTWNDATFRDRRDDIEATVDGLLSNADFQRLIDPQKIGASGHSLGGYTVVGMAGGWPSWFDSRIRAVLALSPYVMPFQVHKTLASIHVPLMYQGGTLDVGITPFLKGENGAYQEANPPAFFVELKRAGHLAWANCGTAHTTASCLATQSNTRSIDDYAIGFFDAYLKHRDVPILSQMNAELADFRFKIPSK